VVNRSRERYLLRKGCDSSLVGGRLIWTGVAIVIILRMCPLAGEYTLNQCASLFSLLMLGCSTACVVFSGNVHIACSFAEHLRDNKESNKKVAFGWAV